MAFVSCAAAFSSCAHDTHNHTRITTYHTRTHRFLSGEDSIAGERLQFALSTMYDADEEFRAAVNDAMPDLAMLRLSGSEEVGRRLEQGLLELVGSARQQQEAAGGGVQQPGQQQGAGGAS